MLALNQNIYGSDNGFNTEMNFGLERHTCSFTNVRVARTGNRIFLRISNTIGILLKLWKYTKQIVAVGKAVIKALMVTPNYENTNHSKHQ